MPASQPLKVIRPSISLCPVQNHVPKLQTIRQCLLNAKVDTIPWLPMQRGQRRERNAIMDKPAPKYGMPVRSSRKIQPVSGIVENGLSGPIGSATSRSTFDDIIQSSIHARTVLKTLTGIRSAIRIFGTGFAHKRMLTRILGYQ